MNSNKPSTLIECDICKGQFNLTKDHIREVPITLKKEELPPHEAVLTFLECPLCGKRYIVLLDDEGTIELARKLSTLSIKLHRLAKVGKSTARLSKKYADERWKLNFNRQKLAEKYFGSSYQLEGNTEQLDYRYRTR